MTATPVGDLPEGSVGSAANELRSDKSFAVRLLRILAGASVAAVFLFLANTYLTFWLEWPGVPVFLADKQWLGLGPLNSALDPAAVRYGWVQFVLYPLSLAAIVGYVVKTPRISLRDESERLTRLSAYIIRGAFFAVLLIGLVDWTISALRVEGALNWLVSSSLTDQLGRPTFRGIYVHYPLLVLAFVIAFFSRSLGFHWLALLIVVAEIQIVLSRFVFSYEQVYMADLVRFWYAALFLFASSYALTHEGHVRVDVFYARFSRWKKARTNAVGSVLLGLPLCWVILTTGLWDKGSTLISPLKNYEISQAGFGMYVKYLMAGYLIIFAGSMAIQFTGYFLSAAADLRNEPGGKEEPEHAEV